VRRVNRVSLERFRDSVARGIEPGERSCLAALRRRRLASVALLAQFDHASKPHRTDVQKLSVGWRFRGRGIWHAPIEAFQAHPAKGGPKLLALDTRSRSDGVRLYPRRGRASVGVISDHARDLGGALAARAFSWKTRATGGRS
jgi:hypothetical protein